MESCCLEAALAGHLSTSSFEHDGVAAILATGRSAPARSLAARFRRVRVAAWVPTGALAACLLILALHLLARHVLVPTPRARGALRDIFVAAAGDGMPAVVIAGDSRARLMPTDPIADVLAQPHESGINVATIHCGTTVMRLLLLEMAPRCAPRPIVLMGVSVWSVNDDKRWLPGEGDEILWTLPFSDRMRIATFSQALTAEFVAEGRLFQTISDRFHFVAPAPPVWGSRLERPRTFHAFDRSTLDQQARGLAGYWYGDANLDGVRWRQFELNIALLQEAGLQVVLLDPPHHPWWTEHGRELGVADTDRAFRQRLAQFGARAGVPVLSYDDEWRHGRPADELFYDLMHLNPTGSALFSQRVAEDLKALLADGSLEPPGTTPSPRDTPVPGNFSTARAENVGG